MTYQSNYYRNAFVAVAFTFVTGIILMSSVVGSAITAVA
jgi:hypothetical protein